jgi:integral membrane protein (TIGR01906 family)
MARLASLAATSAVAVATALVIGAITVLAFLTPWWVAFAQERAEAGAWTGYPAPQLRAVTDAILADLVLGPPAFDVAVDGRPVLNDRERAHMRDVRGVFAAFYGLALAGAAVLAVAWWVGRHDGRRAFRRQVRVGAWGLAGGTVVVGGFGVLFFEPAFELFHRLFFAEGSWTFDPRTERLVQLFPYRFWLETTIGLGVALIAAGLFVGWASGRGRPAPSSELRARSGETSA